MNIKYKNSKGEWIPVWSAHVMNRERYWEDVGGVAPTKRQDASSKIIPSIQNNYLQDEEIKEFQFVYFRNDWIKHPERPNVTTNESIPYVIDIAGNHQHASLSEKGIIFRYERFGDITGKILYEGHLYAVTLDDEWIDVGLSNYTKTAHDQVFYFPYNEKKRVWISAKIRNLDIQLIMTHGYEGFRFYQYGWNRVFTTTDFIMPENPGNQALQAVRVTPEKDRMMQPVSKRSKTFYPVALIGVARDLKEDKSMYGSTGRLFHTIEKVFVGKIQTPFNIQLFHTSTPYAQYRIPKETLYEGKMILSGYDTITY